VIGKTAAAIPLAASTKHSSSQMILKPRLMEWCPRQKRILRSPTSDVSDEDQDKGTGSPQPGRYESAHCLIPTQFRWSPPFDHKITIDSGSVSSELRAHPAA
jgi:hypothetical protein